MSFVGSGLFPLFTGKFLDGSDDAREDRGHEALAQQYDVDVLYECWADHLVRETNLFFFDRLRYFLSLCFANYLHILKELCRIL